MTGDRKTGLLWAALMLALPALFFDWALPFVSDTTLGNDYATFSLPQQLELQFSLANGSFPLFVPGFAGGQTAQAMVLGQLHHPIALVASHLPGYWSGYALDWNTLLRLLSLGLAQLALYALLRKLALGRASAFLLAAVTTYNLRMLDLFRYGAALESWTGHLFLCAAVGLYYFDRSALAPRAGIIAATYWLLTSGHPQMAYYGALGALLFTSLLPFLAAAIDSRRSTTPAALVRFYGGAAGLCGLGLLVAAAFVVPFATEYLAGSARSAAGQSFAWTLAWLDSLPGTLANLFAPLRADVHGAFGGSALVLLAGLVPVVALRRGRIPAVVWAAWGLAVLVFLALQGDRTPVYHALWRYLPLMSSMRAPGRLSLLLPILMMCTLAWLLAQVERAGQSPEASVRSPSTTLLGLVAALLSAVYLLWLWYAPPSPTDYSPVTINHVSPTVEGVVVALGMLSLVIFALLVRAPRWRDWLLAGLCLTACLETKLVLDHGTWRDVVGKTPTFAQLASWKREKLDYRFPSGEGFFDPTMWRQATSFHVEPALGRVYFEWRGARDLEDAYRILDHGLAPHELVVEEPDAAFAPAPTDRPTARVELVYSSSNRLVFAVEASQRGYFTLAYPYSGRWEALVSGKEAVPRRANGGHHAVPISAGKSVVELRYRSPAQLAGWLLGALGLVLVTFVLVHPRAGWKRAAAAALVVATASAGMVAVLRASLYGGRNLGTAYAWSGPAPAGPLPNLAYGRKTTMSSTLNVRHHCCPFVGSKGTDGDRSRRSGFATEEEDAPLWAVDLGGERVIGRVVAYESRRPPEWNRRPLTLAGSRDGRSWSRLPATFAEGEGTLTADLAPAVTARFVALRAGGRCRLSLDEVEIYPPAE